MKDYRFGSESVVSISSVIEDQKIADFIWQNDYIRSETLRRLTSIPSYRYKSLKWKNRYYDVLRTKVIAELDRKLHSGM